MTEEYDLDDLNSLPAETEEINSAAELQSEIEINIRMNSSMWTGSVHADYMGMGFYQMQVELSQLAHDGQWDQLISRVYSCGCIESPNSINPDEDSWNTLIHKAVEAGVKAVIVQMLIDAGGWRTIRNAQGERPIDIARRLGHEHLYQVLEPVIRHPCEDADLMAIQERFHALIQKTADDLELDLQGWFRFPSLSILQELKDPTMNVAVSGMYGGFDYRLEFREGSPVLVTEYESRICSGSEELYEITPDSCNRVEGEFLP